MKQNKKPVKKSYWFEFAEKKGLSPHKSAWSQFLDNEKTKRTSENRSLFCYQCGFELRIDSRFCERCGARVIKK
ncbi:MAG: hypothetical protein ACTSW1_12470 [Candidatus Hodarchaeales archaeon]